MNNDEAMARLVAQRGAINAAINDFDRYVAEVGASRWSSTVKSAQMRAIKGAALAGGVDISAWTGKPSVIAED